MSTSGLIVGAALLGPGTRPMAAFYEGLFGWELADVDDPVRGFAQGTTTEALAVEFASDAVQWVPVVSVASLHRLAETAAASGGESRYLSAHSQLVRDPFGAAFIAVADELLAAAPLASLRPYDPNQSSPGALSWWQLNSTDPNRSAAFYESVLGWSRGGSDNDKFTYWRFYRGEPLAHAGLMEIDQRSGHDVPPVWQVYFHEDDLDAAASRISDLAGSVVVAPTDIVAGTFLVAADPAGTMFGVDRMTHGPVEGAG